MRAGDEVVLLGVAEHGVTPIRTYGENEARALGLIADEPADGNAGRPDGVIAPAPAAALPAARRAPTRSAARSTTFARRR